MIGVVRTQFCKLSALGDVQGTVWNVRMEEGSSPRSQKLSITSAGVDAAVKELGMRCLCRPEVSDRFPGRGTAFRASVQAISS